jgi:hypothetical protein
MGRRGSIILALLFTLLLAASGLALLTQTGDHQRIVAARKQRRLEAMALEQALVLGLHRLRARLAACDLNASPEPESDLFNEDRFPPRSEAGYRLSHSFSHFVLRDEGTFRVSRILDLIGCRREGDARSEGAARAGFDLVSGDIPAGEFGIRVAQKNETNPDAFLSGRGVRYGGAQVPQVGDQPASADINGLLSAALGIAAPDWRSIRQRLGLEPSAEPVAPGVYLAREAGEVRAVFVEGDLQGLAFAAVGGWQSIAFGYDGRRLELRYRPGEASLTWSGVEGPEVAGSRFGQKIVVHGTVREVRQEGAAAFLPETRLELLANGSLVVRSGLARDALALGEARLPGILLMTAAGDFFNGAEVDADVVIDASGAAFIDAQVLSAGSLVNEGGDVTIAGRLFAGDIANRGTVRIGAAAGGFAFDDRVLVRGFKFLKDFRVHFIEEGRDEE